MGYYFDRSANFVTYDCPKGGGTTFRAWLGYYNFGEANLKGDEEGYYLCEAAFSAKIAQLGCVIDWFKPFDNCERVCVKRDPVKRFLSCYNDKILKEGLLRRASVDTILDGFDRIQDGDRPHGPNATYLWYHFAPQVLQFGSDRGYYTHVFDISEVSTTYREYLNDKWKIDLPILHARNSTKTDFDKVVLTQKQISRIEKIYEDDYTAGWF